MSNQAISAENRVTKWVAEEFLEWSRGTPFKRLMGAGANAPIQVGETLAGKPTGGDQIARSLVMRAQNDPTIDDNLMFTNEESLGNYAHTVTLHQYRNAFIIGKHERRKAAFDMLEAMRDRARVWNMELTRDLIIARNCCPVTDGVTTYDAATVTQRNTWSTSNNVDSSNMRILYGAAKSNWTGVHATDLATIDGTSDDLHQDIVRLIRRLAQNCDPHIQPAVSTKGGNAGREMFYLPVGSIPFRDLEANMDTIFQNADVRGDDNHIFANGDIRVGNVTVFEVPEMDRITSNGGATLTNVGAGGTTNVQMCSLLGAQAIIYEIGERMHPISDDYDYKNKIGVGIAETIAVEKATFNGFDHGSATLFVSAVGD